MGGKAKPTKHTAAEIKAKAFAATVNRGGGAQGLADRKGGKVGHAKFKCHICALQAPDLKSMQLHHESKHSKLPWEPEKCSNVHVETGGVTVAGVAVQGGKRKK
ncbi:hypothetical protein Ndes2526B_g03965 [Nannochloris sp. 'desiccata']|nr:hypothetical protein KSW81_006057 [Chlorella desiccata (nom. nud.)]KAH7621138.1 putative Protein METHYLENE BLUE SENSITIVITY 2 [Chlorella desiccata (nom. nud.)]